MKKLKLVALFIFIHAAIEIGTLPMVLMLSARGELGTMFLYPYLQENILIISCLGFILGFLRIVSGIAVIKNLKWGLILGILNSFLTLLLMTFYLPGGIIDGILASGALILLLSSHYKNAKIIE